MNNIQTPSKRKSVEPVDIKRPKKIRWKHPPSANASNDEIKDYENKFIWFDARWDFSYPGQTEENS